MKIVRTDKELQTPGLDAALESLGHELILLPENTTQDQLSDAVSDADLLLMCYTPICERTIAGATRLKGIVKYGVGIDAIDLDAARRHNVVVVNIPEYAEETVAEGAFLLLLALAKKLIPLDRHMHTQGWAWPEPQWLGSDIANKTVGLIGFGRIGKTMARMAGAGFRARVIAYSPGNTAKEMSALGVEKINSLEQLLQESDFVSIHCVLTPQTRNLIGRRELATMKPDAFLINVSRGAIVDELALVEALENRTIAGAGLDVYSREPLDRVTHPMANLFKHPNVILLPHLTFYTQEAMDRLEAETLQRCIEILDGISVQIKSCDERLANQASPASYP